MLLRIPLRENITLRITENLQKSTIIISDTGTGMSEEQIAIYMNLFRNPKLETPVLKEKGLVCIWLSIW